MLACSHSCTISSSLGMAFHISKTMKVQPMRRSFAITGKKSDCCSAQVRKGPCEVKWCDEEFISTMLERKWSLLKPDTQIHQIVVAGKKMQNDGSPLGNVWFSNNTTPRLGDSIRMIEKENQQPFFYVVRDDLLHPLVNGNKARKLDALLPLIEDLSVTDLLFSVQREGLNHIYFSEENSLKFRLVTT
ncbi:D-cysteine desulfhydrase [Bertholletia excelsa]